MVLTSNKWDGDGGRVLKAALLRHPIQPEECWPFVFGKTVVIRRGDMLMEPIIARDNVFVKATDVLVQMTEEKRLQTLCASADLQAKVGSMRGALIAVRIAEVGARRWNSNPAKYEVVTYTLMGVKESVLNH